MKTVFTDFHHQDLFFSLQRLFEHRLGWNLFRPIGLEWWKEGYWKIYDHPDTASQYLNLEQGYKPKDGSLPLNDLDMVIDDCYICEDHHNNTHNKALTMTQFYEMPIDIVIASIPAHIEPFKRLAKMKNAHFVFQMGNMFSEVINHIGEIPNLLSSTIEFNVPQSVNAVFYKQEFSLDIFKPNSYIEPGRTMTSFVNCFSSAELFAQDWIFFRQLEALMPNWEFKCLGGGCRDGSVGNTTELASKMRATGWGIHLKKNGDGYGHVLANWAACGRPLITRISDYKGKLGEVLLEDMDSCIDVDKHSIQDIKDIIENMSPIRYEYMCKNIYDRFIKNYDFDKDEIAIRKWLDNLK